MSTNIYSGGPASRTDIRGGSTSITPDMELISCSPFDNFVPWTKLHKLNHICRTCELYPETGVIDVGQYQVNFLLDCLPSSLYISYLMEYLKKRDLFDFTL